MSPLSPDRPLHRPPQGQGRQLGRRGRPGGARASLENRERPHWIQQGTGWPCSPAQECPRQTARPGAKTTSVLGSDLQHRHQQSLQAHTADDRQLRGHSPLPITPQCAGGLRKREPTWGTLNLLERSAGCPVGSRQDHRLPAPQISFSRTSPSQPPKSPHCHTQLLHTQGSQRVRNQTWSQKDMRRGDPQQPTETGQAQGEEG
uniref:Uncharacterized protein LOC110197905 n=1 Tax=Phascolarctos cinereus TaxID=38626 RepID=A0A6P5IZQ8_PHACI|nr:uncharacterized protein LOC110197905 [Phascolarctos cinereus]